MPFDARIDRLLLVLAVGLSRLAFRSHFLYDIDSVNFALALQRFDTSVHQPHPPGYYLYVYLGRAVNLMCGDANASFVAISIVASCGAVAVIHLLTTEWFGRRPALFAGVMFVLSPLAWFHGTVALTYMVETFFSALIGYLCWRVVCGRKVLIVFAACLLGLAAGFRPSSVLFLTPIVLVALASVPKKLAAVSLALFVCTVSAWFFPMVHDSGGLQKYVSALVSLWRMVPAKQTVFNSSIINSIARLLTIVGIFALCFGCASALVFRRSRSHLEERKQKLVFSCVWVAPGLLFFTFVFLKFVNSGYLLLLCPPAFAWIGASASEWYDSGRAAKQFKIGVICASAALNVVIYLRSPLYCSYGEVRRFETDLASITNTLPKVASAEEALIVGFDSHFLGYRHAGYYLPNYLTLQFPEVNYASGPKVFAMQHRQTLLVPELRVAAYKKFIFFPLPSGDREYEIYMDHLRARFPAGHLQTVKVAEREFITGPIADLPLLFPITAHSPHMYTRNRAAVACVNCR